MLSDWTGAEIRTSLRPECSAYDWCITLLLSLLVLKFNWSVDDNSLKIFEVMTLNQEDLLNF